MTTVILMKDQKEPGSKGWIIFYQ